MKKVLYILGIALVALVACTKKENVVFPNRPAQDAAATYEGTWHISSTDTAFGDHGHVYGIEGRLTLDTIAENTDSTHYMVQVSIYRGVLGEGETETWNKTAMGNIAYAGDEVVFNNDLPTNAFGCAFVGRTMNRREEATIQCKFVEKVPVIINGQKKKKNVENTYTFSGKKVVKSAE